MGADVTLIDAGAEVAKTLKDYFKEKEMSAEAGKIGEKAYFVSDNIDGFEALGGMFLEEKIDGLVEKIDIERY